MFIPLPRTITRGMSGNDVLACKRALKRADFGKGILLTKTAGGAWEKNVKLFQKAKGLPVDGEYGPATHKKLMPYYDAYGAKLMIGAMPTTPVEVQAAMIAYNYAPLLRYTQSASRMMIVRKKLKPLDRLRGYLSGGNQLWEDCSSSLTGFYYIAERDDPSGYEPDYPGYGYTGSISVRGVRVSFPKLGDFGFYNGPWPYTHMVICVGFKNGMPLVFSFGSDAGPFLLPYNYRSDFSHWRRYA